MKTTMPDFKVRLPQSLKDQIEEAAAKNNRSMNGEILARLEASFAENAEVASDARSKLAAQRLMRGPGDPLEKRMAELEGRVQAIEGKLR